MYVYIKNNKVLDPQLWGNVPILRIDLFIVRKIYDQ